MLAVNVSLSTSSANKSIIIPLSSSVSTEILKATGASFIGLTVKTKLSLSVYSPSLTLTVTAIGPL